uniref:Ycf1 n=1 Tax=Caulerpa verticillata TaxID=177082 RepID=A0A386B037_9CHLO|nr:hypothetical protein Ycf1 [Caulerpa verticillata]AYC65057.1 hypothetical protein Ycf1 [Caulerpa verticillata]
MFVQQFWKALMSCKWLDYYIDLPVTLPQTSNSIFSELINSKTSNLTFLPDTATNLTVDALWTGFFNCIFLYLPFSPVQFIWLRSLIIEGIWAGTAASIGLIFGYLSLLACCLFGFREIIYIWFGLEPLSYFLGVWLVFVVIFRITQTPTRLRILKKSQIKELFYIFLINFTLVWTDQSSFFPFFSNLSFHSGTNSIDFDLFDSKFYFYGIIFGCIFWTIILSLFFSQLGTFLTRYTPLKFSYWIRGIHHFCLIGCLTLNLTSFGYYGLDYLVANPLGFVSQDSGLQKIDVFKSSTQDVTKGRLGRVGEKLISSIDIDLSLFDRAIYATGAGVELNFETLNYQEEYMWRTRVDRLSSRNVTRAKSILNKYLTKKLGPELKVRQSRRRQQKQQQYAEKFEKFKTEAPKITPKFEYQFQTKNKLSDDFERNEQFYDLSDYYKCLLERFIYDYTGEANRQDPQVPDLPDYDMIYFSAFSEVMKYGFDMFGLFFNEVEEDPIEFEVKERYSENVVYRFLVNLDISNFLQGLPKHHRLTSLDEIELFKKRFALSQYLDTLRAYSKLNVFNIGDVFSPLFCGPKSYANRIYNQQFKGSLKIVERLFSVHLEDPQNVPRDTGEKRENNVERYYSDLYLRMKKEPSVLKFDQPLYKSNKYNPLVHNNIPKKSQPQTSLKNKNKNNRFLKETNSIPFFVGWNRNERKFVITNRLLTRRKTLDEFRIPPYLEPYFKNHKFEKVTRFTASTKLDKFVWNRELQKFDTEYKTESNTFKVIPPLFFTTWPVSSVDAELFPLFSRLYRIPEDLESNNLFVYLEPDLEEEEIIYETLPSIVDRININNQTKLLHSLAPKRGGYIWPGEYPYLKKSDDVNGSSDFFK